jgi:hypothetical protein
MLRRSPRLTPASLAARRANARKSTGPRTEQGKARAALNSLQHGGYAVNLPERLARAGCRQEEAEWRKIRARIAGALTPAPAVSGREAGGPPESQRDPSAGLRPEESNLDRKSPRIEKKIDRLANLVWCAHRTWRQPAGAELEYSLESILSRTRLSQLSQIWIHNPLARVGLVFYAQRRRGWTVRQLLARVYGRRTRGLGHELEPVMEPELETGLRCRVYRLGRPRFWEQIRHCLDREGRYHPEWRGRNRELRRELRNSPMALWLEPHPILAAQRQEAEQAGNPPGS